MKLTLFFSDNFITIWDREELLLLCMNPANILGLFNLKVNIYQPVWIYSRLPAASSVCGGGFSKTITQRDSSLYLIASYCSSKVPQKNVDLTSDGAEAIMKSRQSQWIKEKERGRGDVWMWSCYYSLSVKQWSNPSSWCHSEDPPTPQKKKIGEHGGL